MILCAGNLGVQSKVALDLVLRLWALWSSTGEAAVIQEWVACLIRDAEAPPLAASPLAQLGRLSANACLPLSVDMSCFAFLSHQMLQFFRELQPGKGQSILIRCSAGKHLHPVTPSKLPADAPEIMSYPLKLPLNQPR